MAAFLRLILLGALWGASFLFMRMAVGALGPVWLIQGRVLLAAIFVTGVVVILKKQPDWKKNFTQHWRAFAIVALLNLSVPFLLFAYGAKFLTASILAIINATAPFFSAIFAAWFLHSPMSKPQWIGLLIGFSGVVIVVAQGIGIGSSGWWIAFALTMMAPLCYGLCTTYLRHQPIPLNPIAITLGTLWIASLQLLPISFFFPNPAPIEWKHWGALLGLAIFCTGLAYIIFYGLFEKIGATRTLTVTFLVPLFATLWGALFLKEAVTLNLIIGGAVILLGVAVTNRLIRWGEDRDNP